jgi:hypothetical protein
MDEEEEKAGYLGFHSFSTPRLFFCHRASSIHTYTKNFLKILNDINQ